LGVIIDNKNINWNEQIKYTCKNISKSVGIFWNIKNKVNKKTLINWYYTFRYPFIIYCNIVWGRAPKIFLPKIHILQKQIIRIISHAELRSHTYILFKAHQIMTIDQLNKYVTCILMYKHNKGILPNIFNDKIPYCKTNIKQNTLT